MEKTEKGSVQILRPPASDMPVQDLRLGFCIGIDLKSLQSNGQTRKREVCSGQPRLIRRVSVKGIADRESTGAPSSSLQQGSHQ